jgi:hypothetical protein
MLLPSLTVGFLTPIACALILYADSVDLFPKARVWIQRVEYEHYVGEQGRAADRAVDGDVAAMLFAIRQAGRLELIDGDDREILPGIRVHTVGRHAVFERFPIVKPGVARIQ